MPENPVGLQEVTRIVATIRRFYWRRIRRHRYEICGSVGPGGPARPVIRRYGCGRPIGPLWTADSSFWNRMVTGEALPPERTEGAGGILCLRCFDRLCRNRGEIRFWKADAL